MSRIVAKAFPKEALLELFDCDPGESVDGLVLVEVGDWVDEGKYSYREVIFAFDGAFYSVLRGRSGSYFTDYYYEEDDWDDEVVCAQVVKVPVTKYEWHVVKSSDDV